MNVYIYIKPSKDFLYHGKKENYHFFGKINIINTLEIPELIYIVTILKLPFEILAELFLISYEYNKKKYSDKGNKWRRDRFYILRIKVEIIKNRLVSRLLKTKHVINDLYSFECWH